MEKAKIRKGDTVFVAVGRNQGKTGKVLRVVPEDGHVFVERLNLVKRHRKTRGTQTPGGVVEKEAPFAISNVMLLCDKCNRPTRVGRTRLQDGRNVRSCRKCGEQIDR